MNALSRTFLKGLLAFLPVFLTVYGVYYFFAWLNRFSNGLLSLVLPAVPDIPGLGIAIGVLLIFLLGLLVSSRLTRWIYHLIETPLKQLPIIKELYIALSQLTEFLTPMDADESRSQVVSVRHPDHDVVMIGLLTRDDVSDLNLQGKNQDRVAVYLPMSYQVGGFTVFVPREWISAMDIPVETAMRETLTGWIRRRRSTP